MPVTVERSLDDPIITLIFDGAVDQNIVNEASSKAAQLLAQMGIYYAIMDIRGAQIPLETFMRLLENSTTSTLLRDPRVTLIFVRHSTLNEPTAIAAAPRFATKDEALEYVRRHIAGSAPRDRTNDLV
jgi:hypothetical protein